MRSRRVWGLVLGLAMVSQTAATEPATYNVAIVPQFLPSVIHQAWTPILQALDQSIGAHFQLKIYPSIPAFEQGLRHGEPDFAYMNPYHEVMAKAAQGYTPLIHDSRPLVGLLLVRSDSSYQSIQDLKDATIAFPAPNAFGASLYMRALLSEAGVNFTPRYVQTHGNVFRHILAGTAAAGGAVNATLAKETDEVRAGLRVLFQTPPTAPHPFSAHPRLPDTLRQQVADALLKLTQHEALQAALQAAQIPQPVLADYGRDYQPLENFHLDSFVVAGEE